MCRKRTPDLCMILRFLKVKNVPQKRVDFSSIRGIADMHQNADFPYKASKNKPLDAEEKEYNTGLSRVRVVVEHIFGDIKTFKIMADRYRNKCRRYGIKFNIIAGIVNLKNGFA